MTKPTPPVPWPAPVLTATFLGRRKRFFADVRLASGEEAVAHCANTGSMMGLMHPGCAALLSDHGPDSGRKLRYTLLALQTPGGEWCGVLPIWANRLAEQAVLQGWLPDLGAVQACLREQPLGEDSRVDLLVEAEGQWAIEVKSVTLVQGDVALFPDAKSTRAVKHLHRLGEWLHAPGHRSAQLYIVQRPDAARVQAAAAIDPDYAKALQEARSQGVAAWAIACRIDMDGVHLLRRLPVS